MKKIVFFIATLALMTLMVPAIAVAAPSDNGAMAQGSAAQSTTGKQATQSFPNFVDNNGDGICDNYPSYAGKQLSNCCICGMCSKFVDENGDGVCDNRGTMQNGCNACPAYIDENGDGVCDNRSLRMGVNRGKFGSGNGNCYGNGRCGK